MKQLYRLDLTSEELDLVGCCLALLLTIPTTAQATRLVHAVNSMPDPVKDSLSDKMYLLANASLKDKHEKTI